MTYALLLVFAGGSVGYSAGAHWAARQGRWCAHCGFRMTCVRCGLDSLGKNRGHYRKERHNGLTH